MPAADFTEIAELRQALIRKALRYAIFAADTTADRVTTPFDAGGILQTLPAGYVPVGYTTTDGVTFSGDLSTSDVTSGQSASPTRSDVESDTVTAQWVPQETNAAAVALYENLPLSGTGSLPVLGAETWTWSRPKTPPTRYRRLVFIAEDLNKDTGNPSTSSGISLPRCVRGGRTSSGPARRRSPAASPTRRTSTTPSAPTRSPGSTGPGGVTTARRSSPDGSHRPHTGTAAAAWGEPRRRGASTGSPTGPPERDHHHEQAQPCPLPPFRGPPAVHRRRGRRRRRVRDRQRRRPDLPHPLFTDAEWDAKVDGAATAHDKAVAILGEEQYEKYQAAGHSDNDIALLMMAVQQDMQGQIKKRPTRS